MSLLLPICVYPERIHRLALECVCVCVSGITLCKFCIFLNASPIWDLFTCFLVLRALPFIYLIPCLAFCFCRSKPTVVIFVYFSWCRSGPFFPPRNVMLSGLFACSPRRNKPHAFLGQSTIHLSRVIKKWPSSFSGPELIWIILKEGWMHIGISRFYVSIV